MFVPLGYSHETLHNTEELSGGGPFGATTYARGTHEADDAAPAAGRAMRTQSIGISMGHRMGLEEDR